MESMELPKEEIFPFERNAELTPQEIISKLGWDKLSSGSENAIFLPNYTDTIKLSITLQDGTIQECPKLRSIVYDISHNQPGLSALCFYVYAADRNLQGGHKSEMYFGDEIKSIRFK